MNIKLFLIKVLIKLLSVPEQRINEKKILVWFWTNYPQQGFQDYITKRDKQLLQTLGQGVDRETYLQILGQRIELGVMLKQAKISYQKMNREKEARIRQSSKAGERKILKTNQEPKDE